MTEDNKRENIALELALADRKAQDGAALLAAGGYGSAVSVAYRSMFHHATALALMEGIEAKPHQGLVHLVNLHFVRTGRLAPATAALLSQMFMARQQADYDASSVYTEAMARDALSTAGQYAQACRQLLREGGYIG